MISSTQIKAAINTMYLPVGAMHIYYPGTDEGKALAKQESYRTGQPYFKSFIQGVKMYSVRVK